MAFDRQAAKQAGYTAEEIDAFLQANPKAQQEEQQQAGPVAPDTEPPAPTTVIQEPGSTVASVATTAGLAAAPYALPALGAAGAAIGGSKLYGAWNASAQAAKALADAKLASEQGIANRFAQKMNPTMPRTGPASFGPGTSMPTQPYSAPVQGPVAPQGAPAQPTQQSMANRIRQIAAQRIAGFGSAAAVPGAVAAGGAAATGVAGGQMAAMTPEQRKAYYDSMMMGAMSGDAGLAAAIMNRGQ